MSNIPSLIVRGAGFAGDVVGSALGAGYNAAKWTGSNLVGQPARALNAQRQAALSRDFTRTPPELKNQAAFLQEAQSRGVANIQSAQQALEAKAKQLGVRPGDTHPELAQPRAQLQAADDAARGENERAGAVYNDAVDGHYNPQIASARELSTGVRVGAAAAAGAGLVYGPGVVNNLTAPTVDPWDSYQDFKEEPVHAYH